MELLGHKTRSIFDRYNITSEADLREGLARVHEASQKGHCQETVRKHSPKRGKNGSDRDP
jgi:hypothetical protein